MAQRTVPPGVTLVATNLRGRRATNHETGVDFRFTHKVRRLLHRRLTEISPLITQTNLQQIPVTSTLLPAAHNGTYVWLLIASLDVGFTVRLGSGVIGEWESISRRYRM